MGEHLTGRSVLNTTLDFLSRNRLILLFIVLIGAQLLTWRAVVGLEDAIDMIRFTVKATSCGSRSDPCHVIVDR